MRKLICWILGHNWGPISDPIEIDQEIRHLLATGQIAFAKCKRCGTRK